jgi:hypothetical protein
MGRARTPKAPHIYMPTVTLGGVTGSVANTGTRRRAEWRACGSEKVLRGNPENGVDELALTDRIALTDPADLPPQKVSTHLKSGNVL